MQTTTTGKLFRSLALGLAALVSAAKAQTPAPAASQGAGAVTELEKFILEETGNQGADTLMQTARPVDSVFLGSLNVLDVPRSVTVLTPEAMKQYAVKSFDDLDRVGAGLTRPNIFGIPGLPFIRGDNGTVYFNGMIRVPNQNETPTSFGSLDAMDIIKGPAPAQFGPTNAGGYVNFLPKSPYFDRFRGSVQFSVGSYSYYNTQVDVGGPVLFMDKPMAYRISITTQKADSYYDNLKNDYTSVYLAGKARLSPALTLFTGGEYYNFKSNENAGWNRLTQDLVDNGNYIYGELDPNLNSAAYGGFADPTLIRNQVDIAFGGVYDPNLALVVPTADFQARFGTAGANGAYASGAAAAATPIFYNGKLFGYKYTPGYFSAGGTLFTKKIEGDQVVADRSDFADSQTSVWFADLVYAGAQGRTFTAKSLVETISTRKVSSYGFAHDSDSYALMERLSVDENHKLGAVALGLQYGIDARYTYNNDANDFGVEPFNRRDVSSGLITPQSVILVGPQVGWPAGYVGGSRSTLGQLGIFAQFSAKLGENFALFGGVRGEGARFELKTPKQFAAQAPKRTGGKNYGSVSLNPVFKVNEIFSLYAALQAGTALQPGQTGGVNSGERNFVEAPFYEGGAKASLLEGKLFATAAVYQYEKETLALLPTGAIDADKYKSTGYELELNFAPTKGLTLLANYGEQVAKYKGSFPFTTRPFTPQQVALYSGSIQYGPFGTNVGSSPRYANNPDGERAGYPQHSANLFAVFNFDNGFGFGVGPSWKESFWLDNEKTIKLPSATVWNANVFYKAKRFEVFVRGSNVSDEDYFLGSTFAPTMIVTKAKPFEAVATVTVKF